MQDTPARGISKKTTNFVLMKKIVLAAAAAVLVWSCGDKQNPVVTDPIQNPVVTDPIDVSFPTPTKQITKVELSETEQGYVEAGNGMAFRFLNQMYSGENIVLSPLSLQFALAMAANGAEGETLQEIIDFLGYGDDGIEALNAYSKKLLEQLPAVDLDIKLKLTDALLVNKEFPLLPAFRQTVQQNYYAAVDNMDFSDPAAVAARINEWAARSTDGFIDKMLEPNDISKDLVAAIMNALYFKAKWSGSEYDPMFLEESTTTEAFTLADGSKKQVPFLRNKRYHRYAQMDGYSVLALPYAGEKYFMYILLPDENSNLDALVQKLPDISWKTILDSFKTDAEVYVKLPKFDMENKFDLMDALQALGMQKPFEPGVAEFDRMFEPKPGYYYWISRVIQKARISVAEWGTEAAAVTVVMMSGESAGPGEEQPKPVYFFADHPFLFFIGEATSGTILFEGA